MGSVPDLYTTGDNDPEIDPVRYYRHYLYCDACGAFELDSWLAPDNHEALERTRQRLARAALLALPVAAVAAWLANVLSFLVSYVLVLLTGLIVAVGLLVARAVLGSKIELVGLSCRRCHATYRHGTPFFSDLDANPRHLTVADVPRPLGSSTFLRGKSVDDEPGEPASSSSGVRSSD